MPLFLFRVFKADVVISIDIDLVTKITDQFVWFDITKEDFDKMTKAQRAVKEIREDYGKFVEPAGNIKVPMNLPRNERKGKGRR